MSYLCLVVSEGVILDQTGIWKRAGVSCHSGAGIIHCESTCVAVALLLPCSGWGTTSADIPAAAESTAAHLWALHRVVGNMAMLTWPADQSCGRHRTLQLGGGGKGVGEAPHPHGWDAMGQLALGALRGVKGRRGRLSYVSLPAFALPRKVCKPAWWSDAGPCLFLGWTGGDGGRTRGPEPASAAGTPAAPLSTTRTTSCCGRPTRTSAGRCAARFPAPAAAPSRTRPSAGWCALLSEPFSDWMTCTVHKAPARPWPCPASSGR